jgi:hypothetical protein
MTICLKTEYSFTCQFLETGKVKFSQIESEREKSEKTNFPSATTGRITQLKILK